MDSTIHIFTDGSSKGNPGKGGFGVILRYQNLYKEHSEGYRMTTNNRMELLAIIRGLELLKTNKNEVVIYSDSKYVIDSIEKKWLDKWIKTNFKGKKNKDLWIKYFEIAKNFNVKFQWVKGHNGHPENERCDQLAVNASNDVSTLLIDEYYEKNEV